MNEKFLKQLIQKDQVGKPDVGVEKRLNQAFMMKSAGYPVRQNSFAGFASWIFSWKGMGVKTALAGLLLAFVLVHPEVSITPGTSVQLDSTRVSQSLEIDSAVFQLDAKTVKDSVFL